MVSPSLRLPGRQAQRPQHLMVALLATHPLLSAGTSGGPLRACTACGHYCTGTLVLPKGVTSHPALPRGDPEPHMVLGVLGPSTRNPSQGTQGRPAEPVCMHSQRFTSTYYGAEPAAAPWPYIPALQSPIQELWKECCCGGLLHSQASDFSFQ